MTRDEARQLAVDSLVESAAMLRERANTAVAEAEAFAAMLLQQAASLDMRAHEIASAVVVEPKVEPPPPPPVDPVPEPSEAVEEPAVEEPPEIEIDVRRKPPAEVKRKPGELDLPLVAATAARLKKFSRRELASELGVSPLKIGRWIDTLVSKKIVSVEGSTYTASPFADSLTFEQRQKKAAEERPVEPPVEPSERGPEREQAVAVPEELPENLRYMPAAKLGIALSQRIALAQRQKAIMDYACGQPNFVAHEVWHDLGEDAGPSEAAVSAALRTLEEAGLIKRMDSGRWSKYRPREEGKMGGRASVQYIVPDGRSTRFERADDDDPTLDVPPDSNEVAALKKVRDYAVNQKETFSPLQAAAAVELPVEIVLRSLEDLAGRGIVVDESAGPDMRLFTYDPPTSAGRAAEIDRARRPREVTNGSGGGPVAGTGKKMTITDPDVRALVAACEKAGSEPVAHAANGHFEVKFEVNGKSKRVLISATPSGGRRTVMNDRARLRKAGLPV